MRIGRYEVVASRWPWQTIASVGALGDQSSLGRKYGWGKVKGLGRFGGGWDWEFGIQIGSSSVIINLIWGTLRITRCRACLECGKPVFSKEAGRYNDCRSPGGHDPWMVHKWCTTPRANARQQEEGVIDF